MRIDDNTELCTSIGEPGIWSWWALVPFFSNDGTTPVIWAVFSYPGWMPTLFLSVQQFSWVLSCFSAVLGNCHFLLISTVSCSELLLGRLEPWLSYFSNVPDLSCKDRSGGYWFICRFLARVRMIISLRSELERWWTGHLINITMSEDEDKSTPARILHPTEPMVTRRSNMTPLLQPRIQIRKQ